MGLNPRWPIFVPSKGRSESRLTIKAFERIGVPYRVVVEPQEAEVYAKHVDPKNILVLPDSGRGLVYVRNWIWDLALEEGWRYFWTFDDNIRGLFRLNYNLKTPVGDGTVLRVIEDFAMRYENLPLSGCNYFMFAPRRVRVPPIYLNNRVYSNMLLETDFRDPRGFPYRNDPNLKYNDDTDLNLRILKDGNCTALFNAFLVDKMPTMTVKGGMDYVTGTENKEEDHRWIASEQLRQKHSDVTKVTRRFGRWHHYVDYDHFRKSTLVTNNTLRRRPDAVFPDETNNYGMQLKQLLDDKWTPVDRPIYGPRSDAIAARLSGIDEAQRGFG